MYSYISDNNCGLANSDIYALSNISKSSNPQPTNLTMFLGCSLLVSCFFYFVGALVYGLWFMVYGCCVFIFYKFTVKYKNTI